MSTDYSRVWSAEAAAKSIADFVTLVDRDMVIRYINHPVPGLPPEEVIGMPVLAFVEPRHHEVATACIAEVLRSGQPGSFESVAQGPNNTTVWYENRVTPLRSEGEVVGCAIHGTPITERKAFEEAYIAGEQRFRRMFEQHTSMMLLLDGDTLDIVDANAAAARFYGYSRDELRSMSVRDINPSDPAVLEDERLQVRHRTRTTFRFRHRLASGQLRHVQIHSSPVLSDGRTLMFSIIHDIDDQVRAEEMHAQLQDQLLQAQKMEAVGRLAGGIAHDFNNLLTVMSANVELLQLTSANCVETLPMLNDIVDSTQRAAKLTRQLLSFSRKQLFQPHPLHIPSLMNELQSLLITTLGAQITLRVQIDAPDAVVKADASQLQQVLLNLAVNARDAMPDGGSLTVRVFTRAIHGQGARDGTYVVIAVSDTGVGMQQSTLEHLFEPFFTTKPPGEGTGLGLAVAYGIIEMHSGFITAASELGQGACFEVHLRRSLESPVATPASKPHDSLPSFTATVLLVEDEAPVRRVAVRLLRRLGLTVLEADRGEAALELLRDPAQRLDLLMTDVIMPGMNGAQLAEHASALRPGLPILYMSGYDADHVATHGLIASELNFLSKPFNSSELSQALARVLEPETRPA